MVDLVGQHQRMKGEVDSAIRSVVSSGNFINGPAVNEFATNLASYLNVKHVIPCANGTDALQIALMSLGLKPGDEVIVPDFTFISPAEAVALLGFRPVLVDVDPRTFTIDTKLVKQAITPRTRAVIPVHLFGQAADMETLQQTCGDRGITIVEDTAQALGASYYFNDTRPVKLGTIGDIGCTSFFPSKPLGCLGDGGALFTNDDELASEMMAIASHGSREKYVHDKIGINSRLDAIQAAVLNVKLKYLDQNNKKRQRIAQLYDRFMESSLQVKIPARNEKSTHAFHQYTVLLENTPNTEVQAYLKSKGVPSVIYYPRAVHQQQAYARSVDKIASFPVSESLCGKVLSLPMHTELTGDQVAFISETLLSFFS